MALQGERALPSGITLPAAYLKIERVVDDRSARGEPHVSIEASIYASAEARQAEKEPVSQFLLSCCFRMIEPLWGNLVTNPAYAQFFGLDALNIAGANLVANSYIYLKTLPEFAALSDC